MKTRGLLLAAAIVAALVAMYLGVVRSREVPATTAKSESRPESSAVHAAAAGSPSPATPGATTAANDARPPRTAASTPLPPIDTPVALVLQTLKPLADAGDVHAACRLGFEKMRCARVRAYRKVARGDPQSESMQRLARDEKLCENVSGAESRDAWRYVWQAAAGGNLAAIGKFVRDPPLQPSDVDLPEYAEGWRLYRENAPTLSARAIEGGDVMTLYMVWFYTATGLQPGDGTFVFPKDPRLALVYGQAALPLLDTRRRNEVARRNAELRNLLPAEDVTKALAEGDALRARYFAAAQPVSDQQDDGYVDPAGCGN